MEITVSDELLGTFVPIIVYWVYSGIYVMFESSLYKYRLHTYEEEDLKNLVSKWTVVKGVLLQQTLQALVALLVLSANTSDGRHEAHSSLVTMRQFIVAMAVSDTWQYFIHRYAHSNKYLYTTFHSMHHRIVVPYAFGALYTHPLEGLFMDTVGGAVCFLVSGMSPRTAIYFFSFATIKGVDDHCGFWLPWNPFHVLFQNNSAYHDIHHQLHGNKYNFSQQFFVAWDRIFGTYMPYLIQKRASGGFIAQPIKDHKTR